MIRKVTFYWILVTLMLIDSWLLSKPNILGKIGSLYTSIITCVHSREHF
jgi:hypothetical protein